MANSPTSKTEEVMFSFYHVPCSYYMTCKQEKIRCPDGYYRTSDPDEIAELREKVALNLLREINPKDVEGSKSAATGLPEGDKFSSVPSPIKQDQPN